MSASPADVSHFEDLFLGDADPWRTRTRWYERRKRALLLAMLPHERYDRIFEPGCGAGELTAALASRCGQLLACDASVAAVARARRRVASLSHVRVEHACVPEQWPDHRFDLVVVSELGYYLSPSALQRLGDGCRHAVAGGGVLVACHWRRGASDMQHTAQAVHDLLGSACERSRLAHYEDDDVLIDVWGDDERSVAQREGIA